MTLKIFSCPAKLIISIIGLSNLTFDYFKVTILCLCIVSKKVKSHAKAKDSNFHIINIWLLITINKIILLTPIQTCDHGIYFV